MKYKINNLIQNDIGLKEHKLKVFHRNHIDKIEYKETDTKYVPSKKKHSKIKIFIFRILATIGIRAYVNIIQITKQDYKYPNTACLTSVIKNAICRVIDKIFKIDCENLTLVYDNNEHSLTPASDYRTPRTVLKNMCLMAYRYYGGKIDYT